MALCKLPVTEEEAHEITTGQLIGEASETADECDACAEEGNYSVDTYEAAADLLRRMAKALRAAEARHASQRQVIEQWKHMAMSKAEELHELKERDNARNT